MRLCLLKQVQTSGQPLPVATLQQALPSGDLETARRTRKRDRPTNEVVVDPRWTLKQKLAVLTQDIELLTQEVQSRIAPHTSLKLPLLLFAEW